MVRVIKGRGRNRGRPRDPPFAIGYDYTLAQGDPNFQSVLLPSFPNHDRYELQLWNGTAYVFDDDLTGGFEHTFPTGGVDRFRIMGIPESLGLDVNDPRAFVTGLRFVGAGSVQLTVTPLAAGVPVTLSWPTPAAIVYGTGLSGAELNATSTVEGAFEYEPAAGAVLDAGAHTLSVTFTPADPGQSPASATVTLLVERAPLTISADDKSMVVNGPLPVLTASYPSLVNGDTPADLDAPAVVTTTTGGTSVGQFPIAIAGASDSNYEIEFVPGTLTVAYPAGRCLGEPGRTPLWPLNADGSSVFKANSSVLVRFRVCDANGTSIGTPGLVSDFQRLESQPGTLVNHVNELSLFLPPSTAFQWNPFLREWFFVLSTRSLTARQTHFYRIVLNDGTAIDFRFGTR